MNTFDSLCHFLRRAKQALRLRILLQQITERAGNPEAQGERTVQTQTLQFAAEEFYD